MDEAQRREERLISQAPLLISVPPRTLLVFCGPAGCGKSTLALRFVEEAHLKPTAIVSSDHCRALVSDDENNQLASRDAFDLFHYILHKRMFQARFTIADSTALLPESRQRILEVAHRHSYHTCLLVFNVPPAICIARDRVRQRSVGQQVIEYHFSLLQQALLDIPGESWQQVHILDDQAMQQAQVEILSISC